MVVKIEFIQEHIFTLSLTGGGVEQEAPGLGDVLL